MVRIETSFIRAFSKPEVKEAILEYLKEKVPDLYAHARRVASSGPAWGRFLKEKFSPEVGAFLEDARRDIARKLKVLNEMRAILANRDSTERRLQRFLSQNAWVLGLEYRSIRRQPRAGEDKILDYLVERVDGSYDVLELKGPQESIIVTSRRRPHMTSRLARALTQLMDYVDFYDRHYDYVQATGPKVYKPSGILIIGRNRAGVGEFLSMLNSFLVRLEVRTYDDVLARATHAVSTLQH